ncbi:MAG: DUF5915 domain-containing protein, partial [Fidelibacterota bacterium]
VMRWMYASQNPEHNLNFGYKLADETRKQLITLWNTYSFFVTYANLDAFDPSTKKAAQDAFTQLDRWILAKVNKFVNHAESCYEEYKVFKLMQSANEFLDDLSNWYVRRNRRRFWKSDSDSDKTAAYQTLYETLLTFIRVMSPIIPFISEEMYQNLVCEVKPGAEESIHLTTFPDYKEEYRNDELIQEIDTIKQVVNIGRSARNKANIKIRQPLYQIIIFSRQKNIDEFIRRNSDQISEELNIKNVKFTHRLEEIITYVIKPNFQSLRLKFSDNMKDVINLINSTPSEDIMSQYQSGKSISICDKYELDKDDLIIEEVSVEGFSTNTDNQITVGIDTRLTEELLMEGIVRDLVRQIQNLRKEAGFEVQDRIMVSIESNDSIISAVDSYRTYLLNEVLGVNLSNESDKSEHNLKIKINGIPVMIGISKANNSGA